MLTEDLDLLPHTRLDAGDVLLELAGLDADGAIPLVVHASADEREAQRIRPGMPARLTFPAVPTERPRQSAGRVLRVGPAPEGSMQGWRIELAPDPGTLATITEPARNSRLPTVLHAGFSVQIAVEERRRDGRPDRHPVGQSTTRGAPRHSPAIAAGPHRRRAPAATQ